jgi:hypothetical protein
MLEDLGAVLSEHGGPIDDHPRRWGWKEPRSIYLLPFLHRHLPGLRFLHVVRDGRDMALSQNQNQLRKHGDAAPVPRNLPLPGRSIALWSWVNLAATSYGEEHLGARYLRIRFEDLCADPVRRTAAILEFAELDGDAEVLAREVAPPASLGRWQQADPATLTALEEAGAPGLVALGYLQRS